MSINSAMLSGVSGLITNSSALAAISDNIANVNTAGYVRKITDQTAAVTTGFGAGVEVSRVRLATDRFLQAASLSAGADLHMAKPIEAAKLFGVLQAVADRQTVAVAA